MTGIRRLFLPHVGMRGTVKHLFEEFQNSLWDRRDYQNVPQERRASDHSRLHQLAPGGRERREFLTVKAKSQREILCELLSEESCAEWLGFDDLARPDIKPPLRRLAGLVREPDWTDADNIHKLSMYRAAAFIDCLRPNLSRPRVPLEKIVQTMQGPRLELSARDLQYIWESKDLSHEERAKAWDKRTPKPFQPFDRPNLEMYGDRKLRDAWRAAVNRQLNKAKALYDPDSES